jgi:hypothetical protein
VSYKTGASFFILSRTLGSAIRLYMATIVLQLFLFDSLGVDYWVTAIITIALIWVYTFKGDTGQDATKFWDLDISFTIRSLGGTGSAAISAGGTFNYNQDANYVLEGISFNTLNSTDFDTTILNTLEITAEWGSANAANSIFSEYFVLTKIY